MTERAHELSATADGQIGELIELLSTLDQAALAPAVPRPREARRRNDRRGRPPHGRQLPADRRRSCRPATGCRTTTSRPGPALIASPDSSAHSATDPKTTPHTDHGADQHDDGYTARQHRPRRRGRAALSLARHARPDRRAHRQPAGHGPTEGQLPLLRRATHPRTGPRRPAQAPSPPAQSAQRRARLNAARERCRETAVGRAARVNSDARLGGSTQQAYGTGRTQHLPAEPTVGTMRTRSPTAESHPNSR